MKLFNSCLLLLCLLSSTSIAANVVGAPQKSQTIHANIIKLGVTTNVAFEEDVAMVISQSDEPAALRFEQVDGYWTVALFEYVFYRLKDIKSTIVSDGVILGEDEKSVVMLYHVQTYALCEDNGQNVPYLFFAPYNFTLQAFPSCPKAVSSSSN